MLMVWTALLTREIEDLDNEVSQRGQSRKSGINVIGA